MPPQEVLDQAWRDIQYQYADAMEDAEYANYLRLLDTTNIKHLILERIRYCAEHLKMIENFYFKGPEDNPFYEISCEFIETFGNDLNKLTGVNLSFKDKDTFHTNIQRCINRSKGLKIEHDLQKARLETISQKFENGKKPDEQYYDAILIILSDAAGYHITDQITVFEFCHRLKRLNNAGGSAQSVRR